MTIKTVLTAAALVVAPACTSCERPSRPDAGAVPRVGLTVTTTCCGVAAAGSRGLFGEMVGLQPASSR